MIHGTKEEMLKHEDSMIGYQNTKLQSRRLDGTWSTISVGWMNMKHCQMLMYRSKGFRSHQRPVRPISIALSSPFILLNAIVSDSCILWPAFHAFKYSLSNFSSISLLLSVKQSNYTS